MCRAWVSVVCFTAAALGAGRHASAQPAGRLEKVRLQMDINLSHLPNYTCLETIERSERLIPARRFELMDTVRLEVALINGKELFSWPGAATFGDQEIDQIVRGGVIGSGNFALHARIVFQSRAPHFTYAGEQMLNSRRSLCWNYSVDRLDGGYAVQNFGRKAILGTHGSFWADAKTLDVIRLEVEVDEIPPEFEIIHIGDSVDYMRVKIGDGSFLLPQDGELRALDSHNMESMNRIHFTSCRQYVGESKLNFDDSVEGGTSARQPLRIIELPPGMTLYLVLETPIRSGTSTVGDSITFKLQSALKHNGTTLFEKGSLVRGRVTLLRRYRRDTPVYAVGLHLREIQSVSARASLSARLDEIPILKNQLNPGSEQHPELLSAKATAKSVGSIFFQPGESMVLPRGTLTVWRTVAESE